MPHLTNETLFLDIKIQNFAFSFIESLKLILFLNKIINKYCESKTVFSKIKTKFKFKFYSVLSNCVFIGQCKNSKKRFKNFIVSLS